MSLLFTVLLTFIAVAQAGPSCGDVGHTCYYKNDPCPADTEDCSNRYSCPLDTNKCCCKKASSCTKGWVANGVLCYYIIDSPDVMVQGDARQKCQDLGADLPVVKSAEENNFILSLAKEKGEPWLGMHTKDDWRFYWVDGTPVADTFSAWNKGEPNKLDIEKCAYMYVAGDDRKGKWNNNSCDEIKRRAICQKHM